MCFANGAGGQLWIGIEDAAAEPPAEQRIRPDYLDRIRRRVGELTVNVEVVTEIATAPNGGQYIVLTVPRSTGVASTSDGRYFVRIGDVCRPVVGDDVLRLVTERPSVPWESLTTLDVPGDRCDASKLTGLCRGLRASSRVKQSVREKSDGELLVHYGLVHEARLTNLGVLLIGAAADRARLGSAPVVQVVKYDERGVKTGKYSWDDHTLSPLELVGAVWRDVPDFRETYEIPDGFLRTSVAAYDESVVRELLVNALVHRPYTQRGDVYLNLHPDRLELVNAGRLPLGVTPRNILHASRRRNDGLARVFHDLELMEREGSGYDLIYERLLASGRQAPSVTEEVDAVRVVVPRRILHPGVVRLIADANERYQLTQRESITLSLLGQSEGLSAANLAAELGLTDPAALRPWIARLVELGLVQTTGRTRATRYFVDAALLRGAGLDLRTTLARIEPHRLRTLILEDLGRFPDSARLDIHRRIGPEIHEKAVGRALKGLIDEGAVSRHGSKRWSTYRRVSHKGQDDRDRQ